jgi:hypothetical protein
MITPDVPPIRRELAFFIDPPPTSFYNQARVVLIGTLQFGVDLDSDTRNRSARPGLVLLALSLIVAATPGSAQQIQIDLFGVVTGVDPVLQGAFETGQPFHFRLSLDSQSKRPLLGLGTAFTGTEFSINVGGVYAGQAERPFELTFYRDLAPAPLYRQGMELEWHEVVAPTVNALPLVDTFFEIAFENAFASRDVTVDEVLALNARPIIAQTTQLEFGENPYNIVDMKVTLIAVVPEPSPCLASACALVLTRRPRRRALPDRSR